MRRNLKEFNRPLDFKFSSIGDLQNDIKENFYPEPELEKAESNIGSFIKNQTTIETLSKRGINELFPIQTASFNWIYNKEDLVARDRTGSGKTLAYCLPITERLRDQSYFSDLNKRKVKVLVVVPTRELCLQVTREFQSLIQTKSFKSDFYVLSVYGGVPIDRQIYDLQRGVDVVVATPGRMLDLISRRQVDLSELQTLVLDEVDEMLDMGFKEDINSIITNAKNDRKEKEIQYLLFSATLPEWVVQTSRNILKKNYHQLDLVKGNDVQTSKTIDHIAIKIDYKDRLNIIPALISKYTEENGKTIIFTETKREANEIFTKAFNFNEKVGILHGDISQRDREHSISEFREGKAKILVATNIAARGLDISNVDLIIQNNLPEVEAYIHRSGRTARAGKKGTCVVLYSGMESRELYKIESEAKITFKKENPPSIDSEETIQSLEKELNEVSKENSQIFEKAAKMLVDKFGPVEALAKILYTRANGFSCLDPNLGKMNARSTSRFNSRPHSSYNQGGYSRERTNSWGNKGHDFHSDRYRSPHEDEWNPNPSHKRFVPYKRTN